MTTTKSSDIEMVEEEMKHAKDLIRLRTEQLKELQHKYKMLERLHTHLLLEQAGQQKLF
jgi:hypothetical protein